LIAVAFLLLLAESPAVIIVDASTMWIDGSILAADAKG
jgi:hypothetical protein